MRAGAARPAASASAGTRDEVTAAAGEILGMTIGGRPVEGVLVEQGVAIATESYLALRPSRDTIAVRCWCSPPKVGWTWRRSRATRPDALLTMPVDPLLGLCDYQVRDVVAAASAAAGAAATAATAEQLAAVVRGLWRLYRERDATLVEVNPLVVTEAGDVVCLDSKVTVDDSALWRQPDLAGLGPAPDERERRAREAGLSFITLDGDIGVIGNGAGLVMSTLDQLAAAGGRAANFCDVGGGASAESVALALELILAGAGVRALAVNIFGGITRGDQVARGLIQALMATPAAAGVPVFVRLEGTAAEEGRALLAAAGLANIHLAGDVAELVRLACAAGRRAAPDGRSSSTRGSRVLVQGITGREGAFHTRRMLAAGTKVVAGTSPGKGGQTVEDVPVFDTVAAAVAATGADTSVVFVPARFARDALLEAADAGAGDGRLYHRGHPRARHDRGGGAPRAPRRHPDRTQLPGHHHARRLQRRHHAGGGLHAGRASASSRARAR